MKQAYPIIIKKDKNLYVVDIPDFNINTQGESIPEAIEMARDAIGMSGCYLADRKENVPSPSDMQSVTVSAQDILTLVDVDFDEYRKKHELRTIRKNLTIPSWLNERAEQANINFSAVLQNALKNELNLL